MSPPREPPLPLLRDVLLSATPVGHCPKPSYLSSVLLRAQWFLLKVICFLISALLPLLKKNDSTSESLSVVFHCLQSQGLYSAWNSPGQNSGVGSLSLLQGILPTQGWNTDLPHCRRIPYHKGQWHVSPKSQQPPLNHIFFLWTLMYLCESKAVFSLANMPFVNLICRLLWTEHTG